MIKIGIAVIAAFFITQSEAGAIDVTAQSIT